MASNTTTKMITLKSQYAKELPLSEKAAIQSQTICHVLEDIDGNKAILVPNVRAEIPGKVSHYCKKHGEAEDASKTETTKEDNSTQVEMASNTTTKMIKLKSQDGVEILLSENVAMQSLTICHALECHDQDAIDTGKAIPVPNVRADILEKVIEYCKKLAQAEDASKTETTEEGSSTQLGSSKMSDKAADASKTETTEEGGSTQLCSSKMSDKAADASKTETTEEGSSTQLDSSKMSDKEADPSKAETTEEGSSTQLGSSKMSDEEWEKEFLDVDLETIYHLLMAANYLNISKLLNAISQKVADMMKGKSVEEIRQTFGIVNDFTEEEEKEIHKEAPWAFY